MGKFELSEPRRRRQAHIAALLAPLITAGSVVFGVLTYQRSAREHRQAAALGMLQEYLKLAVEHPDLASRRPDQPVDARYEWFATHALFTGETLSNLVGSDPRWQLAIDSILRQHRSYLTQGGFPCGDYTPDFVEYMKGRIPELKCAP